MTARECSYIIISSLNSNLRYATTHDHNWVILEELFEQVYATGARNFLFMDVPPIHLTPAGMRSQAHTARLSRILPVTGPSDITQTSNANWNAALSSTVHRFAEKHPDATVLVFSLAKVFYDLWKDPDLYGFAVSERKKRLGTTSSLDM